jgi:hypothetical protein
MSRARLEPGGNLHEQSGVVPGRFKITGVHAVLFDHSYFGMTPFSTTDWLINLHVANLTRLGVQWLRPIGVNEAYHVVDGETNISVRRRKL